MLPCFMTIGYGLLLPVTHSRTINLRLQPDYLQKYEGSSINYATCEVDFHHDDPDYEDYCPGEVCHYTHYWEMRIKKEFPGVRPCCPFHGHISRTWNCQGRDSDGNQAVFNGAEVCVKPIEGQDNNVAGKINLSCKSQIVKGVFEEEARLSTKNDIQVLHVGQKNYTNFCIGIKCDSNDENFEHQYNACEGKIQEKPLPDGTRCCGKILN